MHKSVIKIGLIGLGTVGTGVMKILRKNGEAITKKAGAKLEVVKVAVRDVNKKRDIELPAESLTTDVYEVINHPDIDIIIEVAGGIELTKEYVLKALKSGKSVVTANKDLIALHGKELFEAAIENGVDLLFEASVGGGIPIIRPLKQCLAGNQIEEIFGIINGTTNYMLTKMTEEGCDFADVLKEAQAKGYAEADPTSDVEGLDAARKLSILASIAFNSRVTFPDVYVEGITKITADDIEYANQLGFVIKLLAIAKETNGSVEARVHPTFITKNHPLASVNDVFNAIYVKGDAVGETMFYGRGAGELPTASAIMGDVVSAAQNINNNNRGCVACTCYEEKPIKAMGETKTKYYIRLSVHDRPGVLAGIASVLGSQEVSIASLIQTKTKGDKAEIVIVTHQVLERNLQDALKIVEGLSTVDQIANLIRVEGKDQ
jgi:homoserine dehydrogenase